jgi:hypothetical protein
VERYITIFESDCCFRGFSKRQNLKRGKNKNLKNSESAGEKMKSKVLVMFCVGIFLFGDLASSQDDNVGQHLDSPLALQQDGSNVKP